MWGSHPLKSSLQVGDGVWPPGAWAIGYLICLVILIINIYGLGVGISTIKKITSVRGWGYDPRGLSYKAFNLPSKPDHKYLIYGLGVGISTIIKLTSGRGWGMTPWDLSNLFQPIKKPVRTLSIFKSMAFVKDVKGISFKNRLINWRKIRNFNIIWMDESI